MHGGRTVTLRYAIKVGELNLTSDKPITDVDRQRFRDYVKNHGKVFLDWQDGMRVELTVDRH